MMFGLCRQCKNEIEPSRLNERVVVCNHCGYSKPNNSIMRLIQKIHLRNSLILTALLIAFLFQVRQWDGHYLSVIPLQIKEVIGSLSPADSQKFIDICKERQNYQCIIDISKNWLKYEPLNTRVVAQLAEAYKLNNNPKQSLIEYKNFISLGGNDYKVAYEFAKLLEKQGYLTEALQYYEYVLASQPNVLQVTVLQNYVDLLINTQQFQKARTVILQNRRRGENAKYILEEQLQQVKGKKKS
ncbi:MAG: hypothetical protein KDD50_15755 [Bdellovibrionales bacterium]|nr:hypothetical protein [Bdellovibrionales bacterium]